MPRSGVRSPVQPSTLREFLRNGWYQPASSRHRHLRKVHPRTEEPLRLEPLLLLGVPTSTVDPSPYLWRRSLIALPRALPSSALPMPMPLRDFRWAYTRLSGVRVLDAAWWLEPWKGGSEPPQGILLGPFLPYFLRYLWNDFPRGRVLDA